jgi:hypothetical protein
MEEYGRIWQPVSSLKPLVQLRLALVVFLIQQMALLQQSLDEYGKSKRGREPECQLI